VLRLNRDISDDHLRRLNDDFVDICLNSTIERIAATKAEIDDKDLLDNPRLAFQFARRDFGRLRQLIDAVNAIDSV
jgi:hypothetical protein